MDHVEIKTKILSLLSPLDAALSAPQLVKLLKVDKNKVVKALTELQAQGLVKYSGGHKWTKK
jgi:DNA-binding IclR family transcriptional regulator